MNEPFEINVYVEDDFVTDFQSIIVPSIGHTISMDYKGRFRVTGVEWRIGTRFYINLYCEKL